MSQPVVDTLQLCDALRKTAWNRTGRGPRADPGRRTRRHVVAQGDLKTGFQEIRGEIQSVDHRVDLARTELAGQIRVLDGKIDQVKTELGGRIDQLGGSIAALESKLTFMIGGLGLIVAAVGLIVAAVTLATRMGVF